jgi:hypothetical protein
VEGCRGVGKLRLVYGGWWLSDKDSMWRHQFYTWIGFLLYVCGDRGNFKFFTFFFFFGHGRVYMQSIWNPLLMSVPERDGLILRERKKSRQTVALWPRMWTFRFREGIEKVSKAFISTGLLLVSVLWPFSSGQPSVSYVSRNSSVSVVTRLRLEDSGFKARQGQSISLFCKRCRPPLRTTHLPTQWLPCSLLVVKRLGYDIGHSPPSSAEVKNESNYTSTPPLCLHGMDKDRSKYKNTNHQQMHKEFFHQM